MREYQRLETGEGGAECYSSQPDCYTTRPLQGLHLVAFVASLFFCVAVVVSFLWFLPCDLATCSATKENTANIPWDKTYSGVEVYGGLHVVGPHLVLLERAPLWGFSSVAPDSGRLVGLSLSSGEVAWYSRLPSNDSFLACPPDQPPLCFTLSKPYTLFAINPATGVIAWRFKEQEDAELQFPVVVPDANKDGHSDLALILRKMDGPVNVIVVSGGDGNVITTEATNCSSAANLVFEKNSAQLRYDCSLSDAGVVSKLVPIPGVMSAMVRVRAAAGRPRPVTSHGLTIQYQNIGPCPDNCAATVSVSSPDRKSTWRYNETAAYLMRPLPIKFKPNLSGFLLKLWHWNLPSTEKDGLRLESITERIVLITFDNKMTPQVVNASQTEITRLCNISQSWQCQPSVHSNTALITDVDGDRSQDLISYFVTYRPDDMMPKLKRQTWLLESNIRVIRLEAELPKLYELASPH